MRRRLPFRWDGRLPERLPRATRPGGGKFPGRVTGSGFRVITGGARPPRAEGSARAGPVKAKALQNLRAGNLLFDRGLYDAAASRYYYAVFQASVHVLESRGVTPAAAIPGARRWGRPTVRARISEVRGRPEDERFFGSLRDLRDKADYNHWSVGFLAVESCRREVERFVLETTG